MNKVIVDQKSLTLPCVFHSQFRYPCTTLWYPTWHRAVLNSAGVSLTTGQSSTTTSASWSIPPWMSRRWTMREGCANVRSCPLSGWSSSPSTTWRWWWWAGSGRANRSRYQQRQVRKHSLVQLYTPSFLHTDVFTIWTRWGNLSGLNLGDVFIPINSHACILKWNVSRSRTREIHENKTTAVYRYFHDFGHVGGEIC